jgi:hydrogenase maturation factor
MHDATECGVWGGLYEMARAGNYGLRIDEERIPLQPVIKKTAELFNFDPFCAISEGTLLVMVDPKEADTLVSAFNKQGILSNVIGEVVSKEAGIRIVSRAGERELLHPKVDPYWEIAAKLAN